MVGCCCGNCSEWFGVCFEEVGEVGDFLSVIYCLGVKRCDLFGFVVEVFWVEGGGVAIYKVEANHAED